MSSAEELAESYETGEMVDAKMGGSGSGKGRTKAEQAEHKHPHPEGEFWHKPRKF